MRSALILLACGCNPLFGIDQTALWDAAPEPDAPPPPSCPADGVAPTFGSELNQVAARNVTSLTLDANGGLASGMMYDVSKGFDVPVTGELGTPLEPALMAPELQWPTAVRLAPEGDVLFATSWSPTLYKYLTTAYELGTDGWKQIGESFSPPDYPYYPYKPSAPTRGPLRRMVTMMSDYTNPPQLVELEFDGKVGREVSRSAVSGFDVTEIREPNLSADGLRLVFVAVRTGVVTGGGGTTDGDTGSGSGSGSGAMPATREQPVVYLTRPSLDVPFTGTPVVLDTVPDFVQWPQLTEDCGRMYFHALNTTWYLSLAQ